MQRISKLIFLFSCLIPVFAIAEIEDDSFPARKLYPDVPVIELKELNKRIGEVHIVDVRSSFEFDTLRIKGAINLPISDDDFKSRLLELKKGQDKPIVFYCNGKTCRKSYKAAQVAQKADIKDVYAYDAGIFDWAKAYPNLSELLGRSPINVKDLISVRSFDRHLLSPEDFSERVGNNTIVLDVRDSFQRDAIGFFPGYERHVQLDDKKEIGYYIKRAKEEGKTLMIYDAVGKQVRWLQYQLEQANLKNYYFMRGGAKGFYDMLARN